ncbi:MAG TPA: PAS domain S-box protein [Thermodesulfobacteriota bacterium]
MSRRAGYALVVLAFAAASAVTFLFETFVPGAGPRLVAVLSGTMAAVVAASLVRTRRQEATLEASETRFRLLMDGVQDYAIYMVDTAGRVTTWNAGAERILGYRAEEVIGRPMARFYPEAEAAAGRPARELAAAAEQGRYEDEGWRVRADGSRFWAGVVTTPLRDASGALVGFARIMHDLTQRRQAEESLALHARQQAVVAEIGQRALAGGDLEALMTHAAAQVADTLGTRYAGVLTLEAGGDRLRLVAGVGWRAGLVGSATVPAGPGSYGGVVLAAPGPVLVNDLAAETRFPAPSLLVEHGAVSGVSVAIPGDSSPVGLLAAHATDGRRFSEDDAHFVQSVANVLASAIARAAAERALRESEARFAGIVDSAMDAIITIDEAQRITVFNRAAEATFRCRAADVIGQPLDLLIPERYRAPHREHVRRFGETGVTSRSMRSPGLLVARRMDGEEFPIEATISQMEVGGQRLYSVILRDISERKRAEEALRQSEARLAAIIGSAMDAIISVNAEQRIVLFNAAAEQMFQIPASEAIGQPLDRFIPERFRAEHREHIRRFAETGVTSRTMWRPGDLLALRADGVEFPIEASISQIDIAGQRLFTVIIRNVSERKRAETALARQAEMLARMSQEAQAREAYIRNVVESLRDGLVVLDREGRVSVWNDAMARQVGLEAARARGRSYRDLDTCLGGEAALSAVERLLGGRAEEFVLEAVEQVGLPGGRRVRNVRGSLLRDSGGPNGVVLLLEDITERVALERAAQQADKLAVLGTLSAGVAHEINNPIGIIMSRIELMIEDADRTGLPAEVRDDLAVLRRNAERVARIARSLLSYARKTPGQKAPLDLNTVVDEMLLLVGKQAITEKITIEKQLGANLPLVVGDVNQLAQVLLNLVNNAREAMTGGGTIRLTTSADPDRPGWVRLSVADTGPGIPADLQGRIFDPFFTTKPTGSGLGLAVSFGIVKDHGGVMTVESREGEGATFTIALPGVGLPV